MKVIQYVYKRRWSMVAAFDNLPKWAKIILALPFLDIVWVVYRLLRSVEKQNVLGIVLAVLLIFIGIPFLWLVDIITIILQDRVYWID